MEAFYYAVDAINFDSSILPGVALGADVYGMLVHLDVCLVSLCYLALTGFTDEVIAFWTLKGISQVASTLHVLSSPWY